MLVDIETVLSPVPRVFDDKRAFPELATEEGGFLYDANRSLIPSSLLPQRSGGRELSVLLDDSDRTHCEPVLNLSLIHILEATIWTTSCLGKIALKEFLRLSS